MKIGQLTLIAAGVFLTGQVASAALTLDVNPSVSYQQTTNNPCVIGDPSCKQPAGFFYDKESGTPGFNGSTYDIYSPVYIAGAGVGATNVIPTTFQIGIDENFASEPEYLVYFKTWVCGGSGQVTGSADTSVGSTGVGTIPAGCGSNATVDTANSYLGPTTQLLTHNGNGFSDALLSTFHLTSGLRYVFEAKVSSDTDGMEEFFIIPTGATPTPEPTSILLLGTALACAGKLLRRRLSA